MKALHNTESDPLVLDVLSVHNFCCADPGMGKDSSHGHKQEKIASILMQLLGISGRYFYTD